MFIMEYIKNVFAFLKRKLDPNYVFNVFLLKIGWQ